MKKVILTITLATVFLFCVGLIFNSQQGVAYAEGASLDDLCADYTDTYSPNGQSVADYLDNFNYYTTVYPGFSGNGFTSHPSGTHFGSNCSYSLGANCPALNISDDDKITKIIPKELFTREGTKLYIGNAYGFFIRTVDVETYCKSTVILFRTEKILNGYSLDIKITNVAQIDYFYYKTTYTSVDIKNYENENVSDSYPFLITTSSAHNKVAPAIRIGETQNGIFIRYKASAELTVSDLSFVSSIYNCNSLNTGDYGYNVDNDYGYFFTGNFYQYCATGINSGNTSTGIHEIGSSLLSAGIGTIPVLGTLYSIADTIISVANGFNQLRGQSYSTGDGHCMLTGTYNTRAEQKAEFNGNLLKCSKMIINSTSQEKITFGKDDYARGVFNFSHTDKPNNLPAEYNSITLALALKISFKGTDNNTVTTIHFSPNIVYDINQPSQTAVSLKQTTDYYLLPQGSQRYVFTPEYKGEYIFSLDNPNVEVFANNTLQTRQNGEYRLSVEANANTILEFRNTSATLLRGNFCIDVVQGIPSTLSLSGNQRQIVKYNVLNSDAYDLALSNSNCIFEKIQIYGNNAFTDYTLNGDTPHSGNSLSKALTSGDYYFVIKNNSTASVTSNISVAACPTLALNTVSNVTGNAYYRYFKFVPPSTGNYIASFAAADNITLNKQFLNSAFTIMNVTETPKTIETAQINTNQIYYVAVKVGNANSASLGLCIKNTASAFQWKVNGTACPSNSIRLEKDASFSVEFWINNSVKITNFATATPTSDISIAADGTVTVNLTATVNNTQVYIKALKSSTLSYNTQLQIIPEKEAKLQITGVVNGQNSLGFTLATYVNDITSIGYKINNGNVIVAAVPSNKIIDCMNNITDTMGPTVTITIVKIQRGSNSIRDYIASNTNYVTTTLHTWYKSGTGVAADPYLIDCPRHFNNIYHSPSSYYKQTAKLLFNGTATRRGVEFSGNYNGNNKGIEGITINTVTNGHSSGFLGGLFDKNSGTISAISAIGVNITVTGSRQLRLGGVVGENFAGGVINIWYVSGTVSCSDSETSMGGIVGQNRGYVEFISVSTMTLTGCCDIGGAIGINETGGTVKGGYLAAVTINFFLASNYANRSVGGAIGYNKGTLQNARVFATSHINYTGAIPNNSNYKPSMGIVIGCNHGTAVTYTASGVVNTGNLQEENLDNAGNRAIGTE